MGVGPEEPNARGDALIENEIRLHLALRLRGGRHGTIPAERRTVLTVPLEERVHAIRPDSIHRPLLIRGRRAGRLEHQGDEKSYPREEIAFTGMIPSPYRASRGFGVHLLDFLQSYGG